MAEFVQIQDGETNVYPIERVMFGNKIDIIADASTIGDKYIDFTIPYPALPGYSYIGCIGLTTTYRAFIRGIGGDRLYYTVVNAISSINITVIPVFVKNSD